MKTDKLIILAAITAFTLLVCLMVLDGYLSNQSKERMFNICMESLNCTESLIEDLKD